MDDENNVDQLKNSQATEESPGGAPENSENGATKSTESNIMDVIGNGQLIKKVWQPRFLIYMCHLI